MRDARASFLAMLFGRQLVVAREEIIVGVLGPFGTEAEARAYAEPRTAIQHGAIRGHVWKLAGVLADTRAGDRGTVHPEPCPACGSAIDPELADVVRRLVYVRASALEHLRTLKPDVAELLAGLVEPESHGKRRG